MNTETGQIYNGVVEQFEALQRGEPVVRVSKVVADQMEIGHEAVGREAVRVGKRRPEWSQAECIDFARKRLVAGIK